MKKSTLIAIIIGLVAFLGAVAGALYVLKRRGVLFFEDEYDYEFDEFSDDDETVEIDAEEIGKKIKRAAKKSEAPAENVAED